MSKYRCKKCGRKTDSTAEEKDKPLCCGEKMEELKIQKPRPCCYDS